MGGSVRDSLRQMSLDRDETGRIDHALGRPTVLHREGLAEALTNDTPDVAEVALAIAIRGSVSVRLPDGRGQVRRAGRRQSLRRRLSLLETWERRPPGVLPSAANRRLAEQLQLKPGDNVGVVVEIPAAIPRDALLGERDRDRTELLQEVTAIAEDELDAGAVSASTRHSSCRSSAFVPWKQLSGSGASPRCGPTPRNPESLPPPKRPTALFVAMKGAASLRQ